MSVYSGEDQDNRYAETVSDIDPDEYNNRFPENVSEESTALGSYRRKKISSNPKIEDSGYNCVYRQVDGTRVKVEFYETSATPNMYIRDAISGYRLPYKTSTSDEDLFFSVRFATGENKRRDAMNLFYDNPEQYERHFFTTVSQATKDAWLNKVMYAKQAVEARIQKTENAKQRTTIVR
jgi:hypothetical protein